jgi:hypothetical protein
MARRTPPAHRPWQALEPIPGTVRECKPYAGEMARHRVITADGFDYVVATLVPQNEGDRYVTAAYPVSRGYLVMVRQPLCELRSAEARAAGEQLNLLVQVLAQAGVKLVRARRALAARHRNELVLTPEIETPQAIHLAAVASYPGVKAPTLTEMHADGKLALN